MNSVELSPNDRVAILQFVDSIVPEGGESVWLTGSRARGNARADSDWDIVVFTSDAPQERHRLFESNQIGPLVDGGPIELVIVHPCFKDDAGRYLSEWRSHGIKLR